MRKFKADGRIETLQIGHVIRFIAGFAIFNATTDTNRVAVGMTKQLNYTVMETAYPLQVVSSYASLATIAFSILGFAIF
jgi:hypothetical protein